MQSDIHMEKIRAYMNETMMEMGDIFSHFTITIWLNGHNTESGQIAETDYDLMLIPEHNIPVAQFGEYIKSGKYQAGMVRSMVVDRFSMYRGFLYTPCDAFREAQQAGRKIYYALRKEYPIHRKLGYNDK